MSNGKWKSAESEAYLVVRRVVYDEGVHPGALLGAKLLLCCNMLIVLFVRIKYNFSVEHTTVEKFFIKHISLYYLSRWAYLSCGPGVATPSDLWLIRSCGRC